MCYKVVFLFLASLLATANLYAQDDTPALKPSPLDGTWKYLSQINRGKAVDLKRLAETTTVVQGALWSFYNDSGKLSDKIITVDESIIPHRIDFRSVTPNADGKFGSWKGIYKLEGDTLTLCFDNEGVVYPTEFVSPAGKGNIALSVLRREKK